MNLAKQFYDLKDHSVRFYEMDVAAFETHIYRYQALEGLLTLNATERRGRQWWWWCIYIFFCVSWSWSWALFCSSYFGIFVLNFLCLVAMFVFCLLRNLIDLFPKLLRYRARQETWASIGGETI